MSTEEQLTQIKGIDRIKAYYDNNRRTVSYAAIALIVIAAGIYYYSNSYLPKRENKAQSELFAAERYFRTDSVDKALYGDGQFMGMIDIADQFPNTKAGNLANYYTGRLLMNKGEYEEAIGYLKKAKLADNFLAASSIILRGDCHSELGDYEKAASVYMKAADKRKNDVTTPRALIKAAMAFEASGNFKAGLKALKRLKNDHFDSEPAQDVDRYIALMQARLASQG